MKKYTIRLKTKELMKAAIDHDIGNNTELAAYIGVSVTQVYRATLNPDHRQYNGPGVSFIAGVMNAFDAEFDDYFFLEEVIRERSGNYSLN